MRLLLDTSAFLWATLDDPRLSRQAREALTDSSNELFLSAVSVWEIAVKYAQRRLWLPAPPGQFIPHYRKAHGIQPLPFVEEEALHVLSLPWTHKDPFDRMLICQAIVHQMALLSNDALIAQYAVRVVW